MSTNKTQNLNLHAWQPTDRFLRAELNENFSLLDAAVASKATVVAGAYVGDSAETREISLGFRPTALLLVTQDGVMRNVDNTSYVYGGLALQNNPVITPTVGTVALEVTDDGFRVGSHLRAQYVRTNQSSDTYHYLAFR